MFEILGLIFGIFIFCPIWDHFLDVIYGSDTSSF